MTMESEELERIELLDAFINQGKEGMPLYNEIFRYVKSKIRDPHIAEDVMQNIQLQVFESRESYDSEKELRPWLYAVATNKCTDCYRKDGRWNKIKNLSVRVNGSEDDFIENDPEGDGPSPLEETIGEEEKEVLRGAVKRLPPKSQKVFELVYFQGKKYREAAEELGIPDGTVKSVMSRAKEELREDVELKNYRRDAA